MGSLTFTIICDLANNSSAVRQHVDADITKMLVGITALLAGAVFDEHFVSAAHQFDAGSGNESDSPLAGFQFTGNANTHVVSR